MCAGSSVLKICVTISLDSPAACSRNPRPVCPIHAASTRRLTKAVAVVFVAQNRVTLLYEHVRYQRSDLILEGVKIDQLLVIINY